MKHGNKAPGDLKSGIIWLLAFSMNKRILVITLTATLLGCSFTTKPLHDPGFSEASSLSQFDGCYENCSEVSDGSAFTCLSEKIWPGVFNQENRPDEIYVRAKSETELRVTGLKLGRNVKESLFKEGDRFIFKNGRIELKREYIVSGAKEPGNVFIGVGTGKTVMGIDPEGQGRIQQSTSFAGTGFLVIPVAGSGTDISKIKRKGVSCNER